MDQIKTFNHPQFGKLAVTMINNKEHFSLEDVAWSLGYTRENAKGMSYLRRDRIDKIIKKLAISTCVQGGHTYIDESGLYDFIFESGTEKARGFRKWVTSEVLPSIRKTGGYVANEDLFIQTYLPHADEQTKMLFRSTLETVKSLNSQIETMKPKALFADAVETSESSVLVGELSKILRQNGIDIGQNRLFAWLRENGFLIKQKGENYNLPTQRAMDMGLFEIKKRTINNPDGSIRTTRTPKVTGKGQIYFVNKFLAEKEAV